MKGAFNVAEFKPSYNVKLNFQGTEKIGPTRSD